MPKTYLPDIAADNEKTLSELTIDAVKLYHNIIHSASVSIAYIKGQDMVVTVVNDACLELWGADQSIIGKSLYDTLPDLMEQAGDILQNIYKTGEPFFGNEVSFVVKRKGKEHKGYFDFVWQARFNDFGQVEGITAIATEVTERALANIKIKESQLQLRNLANTMPQVVWMAQPDGTVFYFNDRIELYSEAIKSTSGDWNWLEIVHPDDAQSTAGLWIAAVTNGNVYEKEHRIMMKDGSYRWHLSRAVPQKNSSDEIAAWFGTTTDIHQQKTFAEKLEAEVVLRTAELQQAVDELSDQKIKDEKKDEFISIASHELKTPLTIAQGFLDLAGSMFTDKMETDQLLMIQKANMALKRLNNIICDFLDVNKMQHGKLLLNFHSFDFNEMLEETADFIRRVFPNRRLIIESINGNAIVQGDGERLRHVCSNLLNNAIKYSAADTAVELKATLNNKEVLVEVKDYGRGIAAADIPYIFNRYFRVKDVTHTHQGMGIGLYLSAEIISKHNGRIWVESQEGSGSCFYFTIPVSQ